MVLPPGLRHIVAETRLFSDGQSYIIAHLPLTQYTEAVRVIAKLDHPFVALVRDKDEVTLVVSQAAWDVAAPALEVVEVSSAYRLITFDLPMELALVGYMAVISATVAEAGVSIFPMASFSRDHILVNAEDFDAAWEALRQLIRACQIEEAADTI